MTYIERLLQRQSQMAARLERQSAPTLRLYPDEIWLEMPRASQLAEEDASVGGAEISQGNAAAEVYRQLAQLEAVQDRRTQTILRQAQEHQAVVSRADAEVRAAAVLAQGADMSAHEVHRQVFGFLPQSRASQHSMERISRFFERDARRYGG